MLSVREWLRIRFLLYYFGTPHQDLSKAYHYIRVEKGTEYDILIVGGEDHKTGQAHDGRQRWGKLEQWTRNRFDIESVEFRWSGQVMEPVDSLAFIGRNPGDEKHFCRYR
jgi:hypothetical protein